MAELRYSPVVEDAWKLIADETPSRCLVVARAADDAVLPAQERRIHTDNVDVPKGMYRFESDGGVEVLVVDRGGPIGEPCDASWDAPSGDPLIAAYGWFEHLWVDEATEEIPDPQFAIGEAVRRQQSGQECSVRKRRFRAAGWRYDVRTPEIGSTELPESELESFVDLLDPRDWIERDPVTAQQISTTLTRAKIELGLTDTVFAYGATRTIFRPYQFRPLLRLLESERGRLLIADEVGLGKTIEAGLIWTELDARNQADTVLIVCPSSLVEKWQREMIERFDYEVEELTAERLDVMLTRLREGRPVRRFYAVCSLERLRVWKGLEEFNELMPNFDLIVVDEAHALRNPGTRSNALGGALANWADMMLFLSATPLNLGNRDLHSLLGLLVPGEFEDAQVLEELLRPNAALNRIAASLFDPSVTNAERLDWLESIDELTFGSSVLGRPETRHLRDYLLQPELSAADKVEVRRLTGDLHALSAVVTRTRKVDVHEDKVVREARRVDVELTGPEREFYERFQEWQFERARRLARPIGFVTQMPLRLASSSIHTAAARVVSGDWSWRDLPLDPVDDKEKAELFAEINDPDMALPPPGLVKAAANIGDRDSKFEAMLERILPLVNEGRRLLLFTFSRPALAYVADKLRPHMRVAELHGDVPRDERWNVMRKFRDHDYDIIVASRVASEGLDFEFCSGIVNWDLPWNPMEIEQRIGRIDRFGQQEDKIAIFNFFTPGTIEANILTRVHERIGVFKDSIGDLEPVLQSRLQDLQTIVFDPELTAEQRRERTDRTMAAIEERRTFAEEVEDAAPLLASTDSAEIEGIRNDIVERGRYVGTPELALLLKDWASKHPNSMCKLAERGTMLSFRGVAPMITDLDRVGTVGHRTQQELAHVRAWLRNEAEVLICLDQELALRDQRPLLSVNHALVRAALLTKQPQHRYACVRLRGDKPGRFLVLLASLEWTGLQRTTELRSVTVDLATGQAVDADGGAELLASLADATLETGTPSDRDDVRDALEEALDVLQDRRDAERSERLERNNALVDRRLLSLEETHRVARRQIEQAIETSRARGRDETTIRMFRGQIAARDLRLETKAAEIEATRQAELTMSHLAVVELEIVQ